MFDRQRIMMMNRFTRDFPFNSDSTTDKNGSSCEEQDDSDAVSGSGCWVKWLLFHIWKLFILVINELVLQSRLR